MTQTEARAAAKALNGSTGHIHVATTVDFMAGRFEESEEWIVVSETEWLNVPTTPAVKRATESP